MKRADLETITAFIRDNPQLSATDIAAQFNYSPYHFSRLFKQHMGVSLRDYLSAIKIERGTTALAQHHSVTNSQIEAGYESSGTFTNTFKRFYGISPKQHTKHVTEWVQRLNQLYKNNFNSNILYIPFDFEQHAQEHHLNISIHKRTRPDSLLFLALFPQALPKGTPSLGACLPTHSTYTVSAVPNGTYYIMAVELLRTKNPLKLLTLDTCQRDVIREPVTFPLEAEQNISLTLRQKQPQDPPINVHPLKLLFDIIKSE